MCKIYMIVTTVNRYLAHRVLEGTGTTLPAKTTSITTCFVRVPSKNELTLVATDHISSIIKYI